MARDPVLAMDILTASPAQAGVDFLTQTDTGRSVSKSIDTTEYHIAQWWKHTF